MAAPAATASDRLAELVADQRTTFRAIADLIDHRRRVRDATVGLPTPVYADYLDFAELLRKAAAGDLLPDPATDAEERLP